MSAGFGHLDELKGLEHSTLKVPYETLNKAVNIFFSNTVNDLNLKLI